jgi:hypothetical protein
VSFHLHLAVSLSTHKVKVQTSMETLQRQPPIQFQIPYYLISGTYTVCVCVCVACVVLYLTSVSDFGSGLKRTAFGCGCDCGCGGGCERTEGSISLSLSSMPSAGRSSLL